MSVSLIWEDGVITKLQGPHALEIAQIWLYKYIDLLAVYSNKHLYLKERFQK